MEQQQLKKPLYDSRIEITKIMDQNYPGVDSVRDPLEKEGGVSSAYFPTIVEWGAVDHVPVTPRIDLFTSLEEAQPQKILHNSLIYIEAYFKNEIKPGIYKLKIVSEAPVGPIYVSAESEKK